MLRYRSLSIASTTTAVWCPLAALSGPTYHSMGKSMFQSTVVHNHAQHPCCPALSSSPTRFLGASVPARTGTVRKRRRATPHLSLLHGDDGASAINKTMDCEHVVSADYLHSVQLQKRA